MDKPGINSEVGRALNHTVGGGKLIVIDGGAGVGSTSTARSVAARLGVPVFNTGSHYRAIACVAFHKYGSNVMAEDTAADLARNLTFFDESGSVDQIRYEGSVYVLTHGEMYSKEVTSLTPQYARMKGVRDVVNGTCRTFVTRKSCIMEGRALGNEFPEAAHKFFLTCSAQERVRRANADGRSHETVESLQARDAHDRDRPHGAFKPAHDAIIIDTTDMTMEGVVGRIVDEVGESQS